MTTQSRVEKEVIREVHTGFSSGKLTFLSSPYTIGLTKPSVLSYYCPCTWPDGYSFEMVTIDSALCFFFLTPSPFLGGKSSSLFSHHFSLPFSRRIHFLMLRIVSLGFTDDHIRIVKVKNKLGKVSKSKTLVYQA